MANCWGAQHLLVTILTHKTIFSTVGAPIRTCAVFACHDPLRPQEKLLRGLTGNLNEYFLQGFCCAFARFQRQFLKSRHRECGSRCISHKVFETRLQLFPLFGRQRFRFFSQQSSGLKLRRGPRVRFAASVAKGWYGPHGAAGLPLNVVAASNIRATVWTGCYGPGTTFVAVRSVVLRPILGTVVY